MKTVLFIHEKNKFEDIIAKLISELDAEIKLITYELDLSKPAIKEPTDLMHVVSNKQPDLIIGIDLGGFFAASIGNYSKLLINPILDFDEIKKRELTEEQIARFEFLFYVFKMHAVEAYDREITTAIFSEESSVIDLYNNLFNENFEITDLSKLTEIVKKRLGENKNADI